MSESTPDDAASKAAESQTGEPIEVPDELRELVQHYRVCWELWPLRYPRDGEMVQVGFELDLMGTPPGDRGTLLPGQDRGFDMFEALGRIARWAVSEPPDSVDHHFEVFDGGVHYAQRRGERPDITLKIEISHSVGYTEPVSPAEVSCVNATLQRLKALGVQENSWRDPSA